MAYTGIMHNCANSPVQLRVLVKDKIDLALWYDAIKKRFKLFKTDESIIISSENAVVIVDLLNTQMKEKLVSPVEKETIRLGVYLPIITSEEQESILTRNAHLIQDLKDMKNKLETQIKNSKDRNTLNPVLLRQMLQIMTVIK